MSIIDKIKAILKDLQKRKITGKIRLELNLNQGKVSRIYEVSETRMEVK